jgi:hypothetical protein
MLDDDHDAVASWFDQVRAITLEDYAYRWRHLLRLGIFEARAHLDRGDDERSLATATATATQARDHGARRYELLARLVEVEATTRLGAATNVVGFRQLCRELPSVAGPESWALVARAVVITGFGWCGELAAEQAEAVAVALPEAFSPSFRRYARTRLDKTRMVGRRG